MAWMKEKNTVRNIFLKKSITLSIMLLNQSFFELGRGRGAGAGNGSPGTCRYVGAAVGETVGEAVGELVGATVASQVACINVPKLHQWPDAGLSS